MDLIYKIASVYLYDNQLDHDYLFFYNRTKGFMGDVKSDAPYFMFGSSDLCANTKIYNLDKTLPDFMEKSLSIMKKAAEKEGVLMIKATDFITLEPIAEGRVSYRGAFNGEEVEKSGKYIGLKKSIYTPYEIFWNETKSGINIHEHEIAGQWNVGSSSYSAYRIYEHKSEREMTIRNNKLKELGV